MKIEDLKPGNLILFDHHQFRYNERNPCIRGMVGSTEGDYVIMEGGFRAHIDTCAGIPLNESWFHFYGQNSAKYPKFEFVHEMQNFYTEKTGKRLKMVNPNK